MNEIMKKYLLLANIFTSQMHLIQLAVMFHATGPITKRKKRVQK